MAYPAGPGFGSIQNAPATGVNPTAFPTAPPSVGGGGIAPGGLGGMPGSQGLGNMVGVNLQQPTTMPQGSTPQPYRAPLPLPPPAAAAPPAASAAPSGPTPAQIQAMQQAASTGQEGITSLMAGAGINSMQQAIALRNQMGFQPQGNSLFGLGGFQGNWPGIGSGNAGAAGNGSVGGQ